MMKRSACSAAELARKPFTPMFPEAPVRHCAECGAKLTLFWDCDGCDPIVSLMVPRATKWSMDERKRLLVGTFDSPGVFNDPDQSLQERHRVFAELVERARKGEITFPERGDTAPFAPKTWLID